MIDHSWHVCVLIPARNEEELIPLCLESVLEARAAVERWATCDVIVAVDCSTDRTWEIATQMLKGAGHVIRLEEGVVGRARAAAARFAISRYSGGLEHLWLAHTDADTVVSRDWLVQQLIFASQGVAALAGTVDVNDFTEHCAAVPERFRNSYLVEKDGSHGHVHGANLGVRGDVYEQAGGWAYLETAEDRDLWTRIERGGFQCRSCSHIPVFTSGRRVGRAPAGFADALAAHNDPAA